MLFTYTLLFATLGSQSTHFKAMNALQCLYGEVFAFALLCFVENKTFAHLIISGLHSWKTPVIQKAKATSGFCGKCEIYHIIYI